MEFRLFFRSILRKVGVFFIGFLALVICYISRDLYADFGITKKKEVQYYFHNISDFAVKKLEKTKIKYNTFIFGSSRSIPLYACYIKHKVFQDNTQVIPFHFANWGERIGGICKKLEYLDRKGFSLDNIIILLDNNICFLLNGAVKQDESPIIAHKSWLQSASNHFLYFFYYSGENLPKNMRIFCGFEEKIDKMFVDSHTNDLNHHCPKKNSEFERMFITPQNVINLRKELPKRAGYVIKQPDRINKIILGYLARIKKTLNKHQSRYVLLFSPMYNQRTFGDNDYRILNKYFDKHIIDFSGVNPITNSQNEYADITHYYPSIGKKMIDSLANTSIFH